MIQTAVSEPAVPPQKELRKSPRMKRREEVTIVLHEEDIDTRAEVMLEDLSPSGFSFRFHRRVDPGGLCSITLPRMEARAIVIISKVVNCRPAPNGDYRVGSMFLRTIAKAPIRRR
jgi:hypothetical protein